AARGGVPRRPRELEPGDDHDRSGVRRRDLHRADDRGDPRAHHRARAAGRAAPDDRRPDRPEPRTRARGGRRPRALRRRDDRRQRRGDQEGRGPRSLQAGDGADRPRGAALGYPLILRPSRTLGGMGGGFSYSDDDFETAVKWALEASPHHEVLLEESVEGWKEFELEVMRDRMDNCVVVCTIENLDPMGVHTGDSITVAPIQTLTDKEYQVMRDAAFAIMREIGVETGGSNVQFAVDPATGRMVVIE